MVNDILLDTDARMRKAIDILARQLAGIRTGRASPALVENIKVDYLGVPTPLNQLATISVPEARMILIQPWDRSVLNQIEKAILKSDLGLNPASEGNVIRLVIPPLNEERRKELVKIVRKRVEEGRVALRNLRREAVDKLRELEKTKDLSQDDLKRAVDQVQKLTESLMAEVDSVGQRKESELSEI